MWNATYKVPPPCSVCGFDGAKLPLVQKDNAFTMCADCSRVFCTNCARKYEPPQNADLNDEQPLPGHIVKNMWKQNKRQPLPFMVIDYNRLQGKDNPKLEWMRQELDDFGVPASLPEFAKKFMNLFGDKPATNTKPKATIIKLYGEYSGKKWTKEADVPTEEKGEFERVFNPDAPDYCHGCRKPLPKGVLMYHWACKPDQPAPGFDADKYNYVWAECKWCSGFRERVVARGLFNTGRGLMNKRAKCRPGVHCKECTVCYGYSPCNKCKRPVRFSPSGACSLEQGRRNHKIASFDDIKADLEKLDEEIKANKRRWAQEESRKQASCKRRRLS